jgi:hypothetical protein
MRTLDDCYGADNDRFPLEQELSPPQTPLEWDDRPALEAGGLAASTLAAARLARLAFG